MLEVTFDKSVKLHVHLKNIHTTFSHLAEVSDMPLGMSTLCHPQKSLPHRDSSHDCITLSVNVAFTRDPSSILHLLFPDLSTIDVSVFQSILIPQALLNASASQSKKQRRSIKTEE